MLFNILNLVFAFSCEGFCCTPQAEVAQKALQVYLDPGPETRDAALQSVEHLERRVVRSVSSTNSEATASDAIDPEAFACESFLSEVIEHIRNRPDPRLWTPEHVARIVLRARQDDQALVLVANRDAMYRLREELQELAALGLKRAFVLLNPKTWVLPGMSLPGFPAGHAVMECCHVEHFDDEALLYSAEWERSHPEVPPILSMQGKEKQKWVQEMNAYVQKRWMETDDAAPHPDMDAVAKELKRLEAMEPQR
jgi:hypothetical protein